MDTMDRQIKINRLGITLWFSTPAFLNNSIKCGLIPHLFRTEQLLKSSLRAWGRACVCVEVSEGPGRPENRGSSGAVCCAGLLPGYLLRGSDCLDWWFRMFTGSEGTIIHRGRGQLWIAILPALLSLPMTPGPHPPHPLKHTTHIRETENHWPCW